jgi:IMP dehydrogenase/GMP reductase
VLGEQGFETPVVMANMQSLVTPEICKMFDDNNWFYVYHRINGTSDVFEFAQLANKTFSNITSISVGVTDEWLKLILKLHSMDVRVDYFTVDVATSHNDNILTVLHAIKKWFPKAYVICGNGCTSEWVKWVKSLGMVDCLKVGIGVSAACRTRQFTGFGSSTVSSLLECVEEADGEIAIMSDGGITTEGDTVWVGDVAKALVLGADFVMSGALFSQCIDSPSLVNGYFGNASARAKEHSHHVEGTNVSVVSNGLTIKQTMKLIQDSLRSSISYAGATNIAELKALTKWDYVN